MWSQDQGEETPRSLFRPEEADTKGLSGGLATAALVTAYLPATPGLPTAAGRTAFFGLVSSAEGKPFQPLRNHYLSFRHTALSPKNTAGGELPLFWGQGGPCRALEGILA